jgi:serine/threonine protein kinase
MVGVVLDGSYRIERLLGEGGMGAVYYATHLRLGKPVAVKVMARELSSNQEALERFRREARVTSALGHPHIVQVLDFSTSPAGEPFLVMEFLEGEDLDHRLRRVGRLPLQEVVHVVKQAGSALSATHAKGIVHRDLKPGNIYLLEVAGEKDFVKVLDFGISKIRSASTRLTKTSSIMGTPNYMSPEQALGRIEEIDDSTDQWALACIAWEALSSGTPFQGENVPSILFQVVHEPPPALAGKVTGLSREVEEALRRALAKDKRQRFASVTAFASALEAAAGGAPSVAKASIPQAVARPRTVLDTGIEEKPAPSTTFTQTAGELDGDVDLLPSSSKRWAWALAAGAALLLLLVAFLLLRPSPPSQPVASPPAPEPPSVPALPPAPAAPAAIPAPKAEQEESDVEAKSAPTAAPSKPAREPAAKKTEPNPTPRPAKKRVPSKTAEEEIWH